MEAQGKKPLEVPLPPNLAAGGEAGQPSASPRPGRQAVVAELGQLALTGVSLSQLMERVVNLAAQVLDVERTAVLGLQPGGKVMLVQAGAGFPQGVVGAATVPAGAETQPGYTLLLNRPLVVEDFTAETRFTACSPCREDEVTSGMTVVIPGRGQPYGVLAACTVRRRRFTEDDVSFLQAVANVLAAAIDREGTELAMRGSEVRYRELAESIGDVFFAMDKDLRYTCWNRASEKLTGISAKEAIGKSLYELFPQAKGTAADKLYLDVLRTRRAMTVVNEFRLHDEDSVYEISAYPFGEGLSVFVKDVTERRRAQEALEQSERRFRLLFEQAPIGIAIARDGCILYANRACLRMFGYSDISEVRGTSLLGHLAPQCRQELAEQIRKSGRAEAAPEEFASLGSGKDGARFPLQVEVMRIDLSDGPATVAFLTDVSGSRRAERPEPSRRGGGRTILVVEDDEGVRRLIAGVLADQQYTVLEAGSAAEALSLLDHHPCPIDALVTDIVMPDMSGLALAQRIQAMRPRMPVLYVSGRVEGPRAEDLPAGANAHFLGKPFRAEDLIAAVRQMLPGNPKPSPGGGE